MRDVSYGFGILAVGAATQFASVTLETERGQLRHKRWFQQS